MQRRTARFTMFAFGFDVKGELGNPSTDPDIDWSVVLTR